MSCLRSSVAICHRGSLGQKPHGPVVNFEQPVARLSIDRYCFQKDERAASLEVDAAHQAISKSIPRVSAKSFPAIDAKVCDSVEMASPADTQCYNAAETRFDLISPNEADVLDHLDASATIAVRDTRRERFLILRQPRVRCPVASM